MDVNPASIAVSKSFLMVLVNPTISADNPSAVINCTPLNSPSEITGKPASIASTPNSSSFFAMDNF